MAPGTRVATASMPHTMRETRQRLSVISLIRNEADILPAFLRHCCELFDEILIVDHQSTDGSREIMEDARRAGFPIEIWNLRSRAYFQAALSNTFAGIAFDRGADWVFFLDADEFLDVEDSPQLRSMLERTDAEVGFLRWLNLAPLRLGSFDSFDIAQDYMVAQAPSRYGKVALSRRILQRPGRYWVEGGNHSVSSVAEGEATELPAQEIGRIAHLPIRSMERLVRKVEGGVEAYLARGDQQDLLGFHWFEIHDRINRGRLDAETARKVALSYGEPLAEILASGTPPVTEQRRFAPPQAAIGFPTPARPATEVEKLEPKVRWQMQNLITAGDRAVSVAFQGEDVTFRPRPMSAGGEVGPEFFDPLPATAGTAAPNDTEERAELLTSAIDTAFLPIETLVPSAWSRHVPLLFSLFALCRPRRYVELGSHYGGSFFAACQAVRHLGLDAECVAIDTWQGDHQAGRYNEEVFDSFSYLLRTRYSRNNYYIRSMFSEAAQVFADKSIDMLHIDGLHTYEAVKQDFLTWRPKMSSRGVILMHDTNVYDGDFGVWRLWEQLTKTYPTLNLRHSHGLGIVYVGEDNSEIARLIRDFGSRSDLVQILNCLYRGVGEIAVAAASRPGETRAPRNEGDMARPEARTRPATGTEANHDLEQELAAARAEIRSLRSSTSWKVSAPLRLASRLLRRR